METSGIYHYREYMVNIKNNLFGIKIFFRVVKAPNKDWNVCSIICEENTKKKKKQNNRHIKTYIC
jgi:hypothetical protein